MFPSLKLNHKKWKNTKNIILNLKFWDKIFKEGLNCW
jgi:hypothetical protein